MIYLLQDAFVFILGFLLGVATTLMGMRHKW